MRASGWVSAAWLALAPFACQPGVARADVTDALEEAAAFDPKIRFGDVSCIAFLPLLQSRWTYTESPRADPRAVHGFSIPRARMTIDTTFLESVRFELRIGTRSDGDATTEVAFGQLRWQDVQIRAGQFPFKLNMAEEPSPDGLSSADYSYYSNTFAGGETQGAQLSYDGPLRLIGTVSNGARTGFSELLAPLHADLATTARVEVPIRSHHAQGLDREVSFRQGQKVTARLGAVGHIQTKRATPSNPSFDAGLAGGDVVVQGSGWSLLGSFSYLQMAPGGSPNVEDAGVMLLGSVLAARRVELWAQFDAIWPLGARAPQPKGVASGQPGTTQFRTMTLGSNYYILPEVTRAKVQLDLQTMFDAQSTSGVPPDAALGVLASPGPQIAMRLQLVMAL